VAARFGAVLRDAAITASDGIVLRGWFAHPPNANGNAVILLHGIGDNRQGMMGYAELFLSHGYDVLAPDVRAQGDSGGTFSTYGIKEANDVHRWFDFLQVQDDPHCVFGLGESFGAATLLQALKQETRFCAVVAESSFANFRQVSYIRVGQFLHTGAWLGEIVLRPAVEFAFLYGQLTRGVNIASASPESAVVGSSVPIFFIHGLADTNIPPLQSERIQAHNPAMIALWEVPNAGHCGARGLRGRSLTNECLTGSAHISRGALWRETAPFTHPNQFWSRREIVDRSPSRQFAERQLPFWA
jgi:pimeloyl-ACP methyl ester carboxylesterase